MQTLLYYAGKYYPFKVSSAEQVKMTSPTGGIKEFQLLKLKNAAGNKCQKTPKWYARYTGRWYYHRHSYPLIKQLIIDTDYCKYLPAHLCVLKSVILDELAKYIVQLAAIHQLTDAQGYKIPYICEEDYVPSIEEEPEEYTDF